MNTLTDNKRTQNTDVKILISSCPTVKPC